MLAFNKSKRKILVTFYTVQFENCTQEKLISFVFRRFGLESRVHLYSFPYFLYPLNSISLTGNKSSLATFSLFLILHKIFFFKLLIFLETFSIRFCKMSFTLLNFWKHLNFPELFPFKF